MGVSELYRKKQSDVMRYLLRIRCWQYRQLSKVHRCPRTTRPDRARRLGYKAKQGYVIYRICMRRGGRKRPVAKGCPYGKTEDFWCCEAAETGAQSTIDCRGKSWQTSQRTPRAQLLLGGRGFHLQILRGHHDRPPPQGHQAGPQDQLDVPPGAEAQRAQRSHTLRQIIPRSWQGTQVQPDDWRQPQSRLASQELHQTAQEAINAINQWLRRGIIQQNATNLLLTRVTAALAALAAHHQQNRCDLRLITF